MYCSKCGKEIPDNSTFCPYCKTKINTIPNKAQRINSLFFNITKAIFGITVTTLVILAVIIILMSLISANIMSETGDALAMTTSVSLFVISVFIQIAWVILLFIAKKNVGQTTYFPETKTIEKSYFITAIYTIASAAIVLIIVILIGALQPNEDQLLGYIIPLMILEIVMVGAMFYIAVLSGKTMSIIKKQIGASK